MKKVDIEIDEIRFKKFLSERRLENYKTNDFGGIFNSLILDENIFIAAHIVGFENAAKLVVIDPSFGKRFDDQYKRFEEFIRAPGCINVATEPIFRLKAMVDAERAKSAIEEALDGKRTCTAKPSRVQAPHSCVPLRQKVFGRV